MADIKANRVAYHICEDEVVKRQIAWTVYTDLKFQMRLTAYLASFVTDNDLEQFLLSQNLTIKS
ncbi:hypothetical protein DN752_20940 [Echinicola strongylocentroti]|uniref:Uncharacterized protein n=2 Tax=Echinicola strongylocentroti TaxID=1795355 RepID=A0A2Z4INS4_9BACT|nr:hypothetical protein DN752_20940 [Echinicola strongylocentroti]